MIIDLNITNDPSQLFDINLDGTDYTFSIKFNSRSNVWTADIVNTLTTEQILMGAPLVVGQDILEPYNFNIGTLTVIDTSSALVDATIDDMGTRIIFLYLTPDEIL